MTDLVASDLSVLAGDTALVENASLQVARGELVAILGPNGAGKTSLLRAIMGLAKISSGTVLLNGEDGFALSLAARARCISYLPQIRPLAWPIAVRDVVSLGRYAHGAALGKLHKTDADAVDKALRSCDLTAFADRATDSLSGGEIARVHFARALAAGTPLLIADEPVAALDPRHQLRMANLLCNYVDDGGGALVVLHEVALAARIADRLIWMKNGRIVVEGPPARTLTAETMAEIYGVDAHIAHDQRGYDVRVEGVV